MVTFVLKDDEIACKRHFFKHVLQMEVCVPRTEIAFWCREEEYSFRKKFINATHE